MFESLPNKNNNDKRIKLKCNREEDVYIKQC